MRFSLLTALCVAACLLVVSPALSQSLPSDSSAWSTRFGGDTPFYISVNAVAAHGGDVYVVSVDSTGGRSVQSAARRDGSS